MSTPIIEFAANLLESEGAVVEAEGEESLRALLPERVRGRLEAAGDLIRLVDGGARDEAAMPCGYGTDTLLRLAELSLGEGRVFALGLELPAIVAKRDVPLEGLNVAWRLRGSRSVRVSCLAVTARYRASGDDEKIGVARAAVLAPGGIPVPVPELSRLLAQGRRLTPARVSAAPAREALPHLARELRREVASSLEEFRRAVARRKARDARRLVRYFEDMLRDLSTRRARSSAHALQEKIDALPAEFERRLSQLRADCRLRVRVEPIGLTLISGPGVVAEVEVKRRSKSRRLEVLYDGISRRWAGVRCDGCGVAVLALALCDEAAHVLCADCWKACGSGGRRPCFRCQGRAERERWSIVGADRVDVAQAVGRPATPPPLGADVDGVAAAGVSPERTADGAAAAPRPRRRDSAPRVEEVRQRVIDVLRRAPKTSWSSEEIRREVPMEAAELRRVLRPLMDGGSIGHEGERRGTRYFWKGDGHR